VGISPRQMTDDREQKSEYKIVYSYIVYREENKREKKVRAYYIRPDRV